MKHSDPHKVRVKIDFLRVMLYENEGDSCDMRDNTEFAFEDFYKIAGVVLCSILNFGKW